MTGGGDGDDGFIRLGDVAMRIAEVVRAKRRRASGRIVELEAPPPERRLATLAALATLTEAAVIDPGTGARLLRRAMAAGNQTGRTEPCNDAVDPSGRR